MNGFLGSMSVDCVSRSSPTASAIAKKGSRGRGIGLSIAAREVVAVYMLLLGVRGRSEVVQTLAVGVVRAGIDGVGTEAVGTTARLRMSCPRAIVDGDEGGTKVRSTARPFTPPSVRASLGYGSTQEQCWSACECEARPVERDVDEDADADVLGAPYRVPHRE